MSITESACLLDNALTAWRSDTAHAREHLNAALKHAGELQRELILEILRIEDMEKK